VVISPNLIIRLFQAIVRGAPIEGSLFPVPLAPYGIFPYFFLAYLVMGAGWFLMLRSRSPEIIEAMEADIEASHLKFSDMHKV
jgi:hypothetical protein